MSFFGRGKVTPLFAEGEINISFSKYSETGVTLPAGQLFISGTKTSFCPQGEQTVYGYEIGDDGNITGRYIDGKKVSFETWNVEIAKSVMAGSNFGQKSLQGMKSLASREVSRFSWEEKPSTLSDGETV
jgi:hypothetical protein